MDNYELIAKIKHEAGTKLLSIASALRNVDTALKNSGNEKIWVSEKHGITASDSLTAAMNTLDQLHEIFKKYERLTDEG